MGPGLLANATHLSDHCDKHTRKFFYSKDMEGFALVTTAKYPNDRVQQRKYKCLHPRDMEDSAVLPIARHPNDHWLLAKAHTSSSQGQGGS